MPDARRVLIASPTLGHPDSAMVAYGYHVSVREVERAGSIILAGEISFADDIMRARSRCVWSALSRPSWDWLCFWDSDQPVKDTRVIPRMIERAEEDSHWWIGAAYSRKRLPAAFPYRPLRAHIEEGRIPIVRDCVEVEGLGLGLTLIRRETLAAMVDHYREELWFTDSHDPKNIHETVDLFQGMFTPTQFRDGVRFREKLGEDYAACWRWRAMGGRVQMFVGEGSPIDHVGLHRFTATKEDMARVV